MRCNACWRELEGHAISTTCGHLFCTDDAKKILSSGAACPVCDQVLSRRYWGCWQASNNVVTGNHTPLVLSSSVISQAITYYPLMKPVDINPNDEWINMAMAGISPQILMKSAYQSVMFFIGQKELEMQFKLNKIVGQCRGKCEAMQEKFTEKIEQVHTAYQKMAKRCKLLEQEIENLTKDKQELQEKFSEKSRQKRKLDEMYDQLRSEYESMKRSAIQPASNFFARAEPDLFSIPDNMMDNRRDTIGKDRLVFSPKTPGTREDIWPSARHKSSNSGPFDVSGGSPAKQTKVCGGAGNQGTTHPLFGTGPSNPATTIRNLIISPMKRPQLSRSRANIFTL